MRNLFCILSLIFLFLVSLLWWYEATAAGRQVYLESEQPLNNGFKLCIYSEGVTITVRDYQLCPLNIEV